MALSDPQQSSSRTPMVHWNATGATLRGFVQWPGNRPSLSQVLPIFDQLGLRVADHSHERETDTFLFSLEDRFASDTFPLLTEAFVAAWDGSVDRDVFASLVIEAHLHARQVQLVRAAFQYLRQGGLGASRSYVRDILTTHRDFVRYWVQSFEERFDPQGGGLPEHDLAKHAELATTRDEYRVLDWYAKLLNAITRTTYFREDTTSWSSPTIVLKLDPSALPFPADPSVAVETFVHHPDVEGLHVRYGRVARGGLRWSDRVEDYRDEVLALARAQQVKNSLIVPAGAKGAFVVKAGLTGLPPAEAAEQVRRCYRLFVRGLLDVTDDMSDHGIVPPRGVLVTDADDPYLVVAADKGTAAFSDLANAEAADAGFWLDDAFASGGSSGFNHKQLAVTARGAWVAVQRHFTELGIDPHTDEFTVVGVGDMSGDVFGNGMLLSENLLLVAAFDHRHIFIDPRPDPSSSFAERGRLAALLGSSWADYDSDLISQGGGVFPRAGRAVRLSREARAALGVEAVELSTDELVQAVLRAPVDLLWNGGIGTYVRASHESDADVADRGNDKVRVTADQLRCKVVGEGGNLGLTQAARIEFSLAGGRVNADFIDNAAGVNTSDREVNLKILLRAAHQPEALGPAERDRILQLCAPDVVREVLADSERLTLAISVAEGYGVSVLDRHDQVIRNFEDHGLDRAREQLPDAEEVERRRAAGRGLTRPEIAVILARAKNLTHELLLEGRIPDDPSVAGVLLRYFPEAVRESYALQIPAHPLGREIIATRLANELIDRVGPGFVYRIEDRTGASNEQAVRSILIAKDLLRLDALWDDLTPYPVAPTIPIRHALERVLDYNACWLVRRKGVLGWIRDEVDLFAEPVGRLHISLAARPVSADRSLSAALAQLESLGAPQELLARTRAVASMRAGLALAAAAAEGGFDVVELERIYGNVGDAVNLSWLYAAIPTSSADTHWVQLAKASLRDELEALTVVLAADVLRTGGLAPWIRRHEDALARVRAAYAGLSDSADVDVAMLTVGVQVLRDLCYTLDR